MSIILKNYWKSILFTLLIFYLSFAKPTSFKDLNVINITDKTAHYLVYVAYGMILIFDFLRKNRKGYSTFAFIAFCIVSPILLGGIIEIVQETFFKPRSAEWIDWLADVFGILTGWLIMHFLKGKTKFF
jgi:VanZ family protein